MTVKGKKTAFQGCVWRLLLLKKEICMSPPGPWVAFVEDLQLGNVDPGYFSGVLLS